MQTRLASARLLSSLPLLLGALLAFGPGCSGDDATETEASSSTSTSSATTGAGGGGDGGAGGGATGTGGFATAPHRSFPELTGDVAVVIPHAKLVTITFQGYAEVATVEAAGDALVGSAWLDVVGADYGVGAGEHLAKVVLPEAPPASLDDPELLLLIDKYIGLGTVPPPDASTIYMVYIDPATTFDDGDGYILCLDDYSGYHWQADVPSGTLTYAIVGDCGNGIDDVTATFAHEYIEASTDPGPEGGFYLQTSDTDPWYVLSGLENADLCDDADYHVEGGLSFQKSWSNAAAKAAASSPCVPHEAGEVFYDVSAEPHVIPELSAGESAVFTLTGWSTVEMAPWALDYDDSYYGDFAPGVVLGDTMIGNGDTVTVTLTVPAGTAPGLLGTAMIYSGEGYARFWPVSVWSK